MVIDWPREYWLAEKGKSTKSIKIYEICRYY